MPRPRVSTTRFPRGSLLWMALCLLLLVGVGSIGVDLAHLPDGERRTANSNSQRVIIDPVSGTVSGLPQAKEAPAFEVSTDENAATITPATTPAEEKPPEEKTAETPTKASAPMPAPAPVTVPESHIPVDADSLRTKPVEAALPELPSSHDSLVAPMAPEITEIGKMPLPKRGDKDASPAALYAKHFTRNPHMHYLSIVLTDAGFTDNILQQILTLPHEVTVAFSPYALKPQPQIALLHTAGFETWGMLPAETARYPQDDPGPLGLLRGQPTAEAIDRLHQVMANTLGAVGLVLPLDDALSTAKDFTPILQEIDTRGLLLLSTTPGRSAGEITRDEKLQSIILRADIVLDSTQSDAFIQSKLAGLKALAMQQGNLVVLASARPQTLALLADWLKKNPLAPEVALAPLSAMQTPAAPPAEAPADAAKDAPKEEKK